MTETNIRHDILAIAGHPPPIVATLKIITLTKIPLRPIEVGLKTATIRCEIKRIALNRRHCTAQNPHRILLKIGKAELPIKMQMVARTVIALAP